LIVRPFDWPAMMIQLRSLGLSIRQIAAETDISKSTLTDLGNGYNHPGHWNGEKLIAYYQERIGCTREQLPTVNSYWPGIRTGT
jgi:lambda repressor-like predicted transcriptional regulator